MLILQSEEEVEIVVLCPRDFNWVPFHIIFQNGYRLLHKEIPSTYTPFTPRLVKMGIERVHSAEYMIRVPVVDSYCEDGQSIY